MINRRSIQQKLSEIEANKPLLELPNSELPTTLDRIRGLQTILYRLASTLDDTSMEVIQITQLTLKKFSDDIIHIFAMRYMQNNWEALQNWENEGGKIVYASV